MCGDVTAEHRVTTAAPDADETGVGHGVFGMYLDVAVAVLLHVRRYLMSSPSVMQQT